MLSYIGIVFGLTFLLRVYMDLEGSLLFTYIVALFYSMVIYTIYGNFTFRVSFNLWWVFLILLTSSLLVDSELPFPRIYCSVKTFIVISLMGPLSEELIFRGVLLSLNDNVLLNATIFSLLHFNPKPKENWFTLIYAFFFGLVAGESVLSSESLFCAILFHVLNNSLEFILKCRGVKIHWR